MKIKDLQIWSAIGVIIFALLLSWAGAVVYAYVAEPESYAGGRKECAATEVLIPRVGAAANLGWRS